MQPNFGGSYSLNSLKKAILLHFYVTTIKLFFEITFSNLCIHLVRSDSLESCDDTFYDYASGI